MRKPSDLEYMNYAIQLAKRGLGVCAPNPSVGCVIVKNGQIIAAEHTAPNGRPHAESQALANCVEDPQDADVYVTLEPCAHYGVTPPCAEALLKAKVKRVFIAQIDPDPRVAGKGAKILADSGIAINVGLCYDEAEEINRGFFKRIALSRPFVTVKIATDSVGRYATAKNGKPVWVSSEKARKHVQLLRATMDAIITTSATAIADNPQLNCRLNGLEDFSPQRILIDRNLQVPSSTNLFKNPPLWVYTKKLDEIPPLMGVKYIQNADLSFEWILQELAKEGKNNLLVEAGPRFVKELLDGGFVDELIWYKSKKQLNVKMPFFLHEHDIKNLAIAKTDDIGEEQIHIFRR